jgi:hypothetical protein
MTLPPHLRTLLRLRRARVDFLMVGAMALNNFAPEISATYSTGDCDILLRPTQSNWRRALCELERAGYRLSVNDEPLIRPDALILRRLLEARVTVRAEKEGGLPLDLLVEAKGFAFADWWKRRTRFKAGNAMIPCASLDQILESKRQAGRDKDRVLLALYEAANRPPRRRKQG